MSSLCFDMVNEPNNVHKALLRTASSRKRYDLTCPWVSKEQVLVPGELFFFGEFDSGSERTLAAWIRHASRTGIHGFKFSDKNL
jgi:hypothetical protein